MKEEILPINLLRFLAALSILFVHKFAFLIEIGYLPRFLKCIIPFTNYGYLGVNLFFLISGFVITLSSEGRTFRQFISARFIRLFPVFWICVSITSLLTLVLSHEHIPLGQYLANLTMAPEHYGGYGFIDGSYWTLFIELKFYMCIALILLLQPLISISLQKTALLLTLPLLYCILYFNPYSVSFIDTIILTIFSYIGSEYAQYFIGGILFYGIYKNKRSYYHYVGISICYIVAILQATDSSSVSLKPSIIALYITVFFGIFLIIALKKITNNSFLFLGKQYRKILVTLGAVTYPFYLLHSSIISLLIKTFTHYHIPNYAAAPLLLSSILLLVALVNKLDFYIHIFWKQWYFYGGNHI